MNDLLKDQDSLMKFKSNSNQGASTFLFWLQGLKRLGSLIPDMGGVSDMRLLMMIKSSITNEEDKKAIANMGTVAAITNHISAKYMNVKTLIKETIRDIKKAPTPRNAALAVANIELTINICKILEGVHMLD